ncbi:CheY chemotaxis protein or a CheY-like REC (receiver) domain [Roseateles sp. YR242]|uniref:response regulator n=1 Tax=Roseateles sp. YR242 TaxID=1855305 RepID=UPI0008C37B00|nr:response regulator [Roseateles sp. YR242]SEL19173.1 CheY chemotaxis protein or a CheY-like REC (receiver) domain [Roseateles sp. YR242]
MNDGLTSVLYVEDSPLNVIVMEAMFEQRRDLRLHVAEAGMPAWRISARLHPSLLLVDLNLPDCHGSELLKLLRMRRGWAGVPAIAVTADSDFDAVGAGFQEMWAKPLDVRRTLARLSELLPPPRGVHGPAGGWEDGGVGDPSQGRSGDASLPSPGRLAAPGMSVSTARPSRSLAATAAYRPQAR